MIRGGVVIVRGEAFVLKGDVTFFRVDGDEMLKYATPIAERLHKIRRFRQQRSGSTRFDLGKLLDDAVHLSERGVERFWIR